MSQSISQFANQSMNKYVKEYTWRQLKAAVAANLYNRIGLEGTLFCIHVSMETTKNNRGRPKSGISTCI